MIFVNLHYIETKHHYHTKTTKKRVFIAQKIISFRIFVLRIDSNVDFQGRLDMKCKSCER